MDQWLSFSQGGKNQQGSGNWREKIKATSFECPCPLFSHTSCQTPKFPETLQNCFDTWKLWRYPTSHYQDAAHKKPRGRLKFSLWVSWYLCLLHIAPHKEQLLGDNVSRFEWHWSGIIFFFWFGCFFAIYFQSWVVDYRAFGHLLTCRLASGFISCLSQPINFQGLSSLRIWCWDFSTEN